jgi:hypothetical protein
VVNHFGQPFVHFSVVVAIAVLRINLVAIMTRTAVLNTQRTIAFASSVCCLVLLSTLGAAQCVLSIMCTNPSLTPLPKCRHLHGPTTTTTSARLTTTSFAVA